MLTSANPPGKVFNTIQILRGLAALIVVLYHLTLGYQIRGQQAILGGLFRNGFAGVDLFFVISGFVIMHASHKYFGVTGYFGTYLRKRLIRIYPVYWITLLAIIFGVVCIEFITRKPTGYLPTNWFLMLSSFLLLPNHPNINGVTWSLSFELNYYFLFGLLILSRQLWPVIGIILILSGVAILSPVQFIAENPLLFFFFSPYNLEFASGVAAWWIIHHVKLSSLLCFLLLLTSAVLLFIHDDVLVSETARRVMLYGTSSFLLVLSFTGLERNGWFRPSAINRFFMKIGDASYLIYIIHFPFITFYGKLVVPALDSLAGHNMAAILFTTIIVALGVDLHNRFEAPLVKKLNLLFKPVSPNPNHG